MIIGVQATALERQTVFTELLDLILTRHVEKSRTIWDPVVHRAVRRMRDLIHDRHADDRAPRTH